jgi:hypothetical protein
MGVAVLTEVIECADADDAVTSHPDMAFMYKKFKKMVNPRRRKKPTVT